MSENPMDSEIVILRYQVQQYVDLFKTTDKQMQTYEKQIEAYEKQIQTYDNQLRSRDEEIRSLRTQVANGSMRPQYHVQQQPAETYGC